MLEKKKWFRKHIRRMLTVVTATARMLTVGVA